jgi:site-specific recombinase XerD
MSSNATDPEHTFATKLLSIGTEAYPACKLLGRKDITTTIYAKVVDQEKKEAVE